MKKVFNTSGAPHEAKITHAVQNFATEGRVLVEGKRNTLKLFPVKDMIVNIKSFRKPSLLNKIIYKYFRKSKARRSFEYATKLLENGIGTPQPLAFFENYDIFGLADSYYACEHLEPDLTYRELVSFPDYPDHEAILRQFTRFSFTLHERGIEFKDHSPGNTLIRKKGDGTYSFYLVDLNRMEFHIALDFDQRMENLKRLTPKQEMVAVMANEYAKLYTERTERELFTTLWEKTAAFQRKFWRKRELKKKLRFFNKNIGA